MINKKILLSLLLLFIAGCAAAPQKPAFTPQDSPYRAVDSLGQGEILHVPTGVKISQESLLDLVSDRRIVYVGEAHTNLAHHRVQYEILKALEARHPGRLSIGMEMFDRSAQPVLDRWVAGEIDRKEFLRTWYAQWTADYDYYRGILEFAREKRIPVIALNATPQQVREMSEKGLKGLSPSVKGEIPHIDADDPYHRQALEAAFQGHSRGRASHAPDPEAFERFYQTMLLWDETMAESVAGYLESPDGKGRKMIVLAGGFHVAYGFGIPRRVFRRLPVSYAIVLPQTDEIPAERPDLKMEMETPLLPLYIADFVWKTGYEDLEKKRVLLGVLMERTEQGIAIKEISPGSPAAKAGLRAGDLLISFDGHPIEESFDLVYLVRQKNFGDKADVKYIRQGQPFEAEVTFRSLSHP